MLVAMRLTAVRCRTVVNIINRPLNLFKMDKTKDEETSGSSPDSTESTLEALRRYLSNKLHLNDDDEDSAPSVKILEKNDLDGVVDYIKTNNCKRIITMAGAGISTSAGIPDFRSPKSGLYANLEKYKLPQPEAIFHLDFFEKNPQPFFALAKELYPGNFTPTPSHHFIKLLNDKGLLLRHYTQNIDMLERHAGVPTDKLVEAHGTFHDGHCLKCQRQYDLEWMRARIFDDKIPKCEDCDDGIVKPDITFFGEALPTRFYDLYETDFPNCDLLIILGSSLIVQPFAGLIDLAPPTCPRLLINREKVGGGRGGGLMSLMGLNGGLQFDKKSNSRDVAWLGECDAGCQLLAEKLGWQDDFDKLCAISTE